MTALEEAQLITARKFNVPLYYVQINYICYEKRIEWFYLYCGEEKGNEY